jgi:hypothetical protein
LAEEGDITIRGIIARNKPRYLINELHKEKSGSMDLQHRTLTERVSFGGEALPCIQVSILPPFVLDFSFFSIVKK